MNLAIQASFPVRDYDLAATLGSGQAFRWRPVGDAWEGIVAGRWLRLRQVGDHLHVETTAPQADWHWLRHFLQLDAELPAILASFPDDPPMRAAVAACRGLRLLRQEPWECLVSFICSSTKQIVQIQQIIALLCERFGEPVAVGDDVDSPPAPVGRDCFKPQLERSEAGAVSISAEGAASQATRFARASCVGRWGSTESHPTGDAGVAATAFVFPSAARLAACSEAELRTCKMGFRAPYILAAAQAVASGQLDLAELHRLPTEHARAALVGLHGVGRKIADCVLLFAYGKQDAFPVDVWVRRALTELYFPRRRPSEIRLAHFANTHFGPNAGYAQQYLFHYVRVKKSSE